MIPETLALRCKCLQVSAGMAPGKQSDRTPSPQAFQRNV